MSASRSTPRLRLTALLLAGTLAAVAVSARPLLDGLAGEFIQLGGLACVACAALGRVWTSAYVAGFKDARLVREGPYSAVRHPLYSLSMLAMLGVGLATRSLLLTLALTLVFALLYGRAAGDEDEFLARAHGDAFAEYARTVPAFLPRWRMYRVPETLDVRPRVFWKSFLDAGSLVGLWALVRLADVSQLTGLTPTWLVLP